MQKAANKYAEEAVNKAMLAIAWLLRSVI